MNEKKKIRASLRKNLTRRTRKKDLTRGFHEEQIDQLDAEQTERLSGKGELTRKRTVVGAKADRDDAGFAIQPGVDVDRCLRGRVLAVKGLLSMVAAEDGKLYRCGTRRLLKTLSTDQRHVVAAGDRVWFRPEGADEGIIQRVEPRRGVLSRLSKGREHLIVTNVDQLLMVTSAAEPYLKPNLIDRFLVTAEQRKIRPLICINKIDLVDPADLEPLVGVYSQMGYPVVLVSVKTGQNVGRLRPLIKDRETVVAGQSGVGKSSLLNALDKNLSLAVQSVSAETQKGRHTTSTAQLIPLSGGGYIVDTPGIRQFQLWDVVPEEVAGLYRDIRPYVSHCRYPDCTHTHEDDCAVKNAVADGRIDPRRYESYQHLHQADGSD